MQRHGLQHIGQIIRQRYPESWARRDVFAQPRRILRLVNQTRATVLASLIFVVAPPMAFYLLTNDKPLYGLAALATALGAAFGPKIYADFIQPKASAVEPR